MLSTLILLLLVATPSPADVPSAIVAPGVYHAPPRCPDALLASDLPDWCVRVWLAVRKVQGANAHAWAKSGHYAEVANKSVSQTRNALSKLRAEGWIEAVGKEGNTPLLRCLVPIETVTTSDGSVTQGDGSVTTSDGKRHHGEHSVSPPVTVSVTTSDGPYKEESGQGIRTGNPSSQQQQQQGGAKDRGEGAASATERYPYDEGLAKKLIGKGVHVPVAAELVTRVPAARVLKELERVRRLEGLGKVDQVGGLLVRYLREPEQDLPGWGGAEAEVEA